MLRKRFVLWTMVLALTLAPLAALAQIAPPALLTRNDLAQATGLQLTPAKATLYVGADGVGTGIALVAQVQPEGADGQLTWTSSKSAVASVDENGYVTAHKKGTAVITCRTNDGSKRKRTCRITVKAQPPTSLTLSQQRITLMPGATYQTGYRIEPSNAVNQKVKWKSSKTGVVKVSSSGRLTAVKPGSAVITCRTADGGLTARLNVEVGFGDSDIYYVAIGQAEYMSSSVSDLPSAYDDAKRFAATLKSCDLGQKSMTGAEYYDLTAAQLRQVLAALPLAGMGENDVTYFYYSGHGLNSGNQALRGALVGSDFNAVQQGYLTVDEVREYLDQVPGKVVVVLDCCLAGQYITAKGVSAAVTQAQVQETANALADAFKGGTVTARGINSLISGNPNQDKYKIVASCKSMELSYVSSANNFSIFTRYITEGAGVTGAEQGVITITGTLPADTNKDGYVSLAELKKYAAPKVARVVKQQTRDKQTMVVWPANDTFPVFARLG